MRRRLGITVLLGVLAITGCAGLFFEAPVITLKAIHVQQLSLTDASLVFVAEIQNPNRYELRLKSLNYIVHLNNREAGSGSLQKEITVSAASVIPVEIPLSARFGSLGDIAGMYFTGKDLPYRIEGKAVVKAGLFDRTFPFSHTGFLSQKNDGS